MLNFRCLRGMVAHTALFVDTNADAVVFVSVKPSVVILKNMRVSGTVSVGPLVMGDMNRGTVGILAPDMVGRRKSQRG